MGLGDAGGRPPGGRWSLPRRTGAQPIGDGDATMRIGYTVTRKIGNAVVRNRMKRRLRALVRDVLPAGGIHGADHVLIGRAGGIERDYAALRTELAKALRKVAR